MSVIALTIAGFIASKMYGAKKIVGPALATLACGGWIVYDIATRRFDLLWSAVPNFVIHSFNLVQWCTLRDGQQVASYQPASLTFRSLAAMSEG